MEGGGDGRLVQNAMTEILIGGTVSATVEDPDLSPVVDGQTPNTTHVLRQRRRLGALLAAIVATSTGNNSVVTRSQP